MRISFAIFIIFLSATTGAFSQEKVLQPLDVPGVFTLDFYDTELGYYVFLDEKNLKKDNLPVTVFIHGYGALNPMIFGKWLQHLVEKGHCVIYPRYQTNLFAPPSELFVPNTVQAIKSAFHAIDSVGIKIDKSKFYMASHSYGGVIAANISVHYEELGIPKPLVSFLGEPGSGPLTGGVLETYEGMPADLILAIMVGEHDATVGSQLGELIYHSAGSTPNRMLVWQYAGKIGDQHISASHYEPYALDETYDNGIANFTTKRAEKEGKLDRIDTHGYWLIFDELVDLANQGRDLDEKLVSQLATLGVDSEGDDRLLEIRIPAHR